MEDEKKQSEITHVSIGAGQIWHDLVMRSLNEMDEMRFYSSNWDMEKSFHSIQNLFSHCLNEARVRLDENPNDSLSLEFLEEWDKLNERYPDPQGNGECNIAKVKWRPDEVLERYGVCYRFIRKLGFLKVREEGGAWEDDFITYIQERMK